MNRINGKTGWVAIGHGIWIYIDNNEATVVATTRSNFDYVRDMVECYIAEPVELDTWFCPNDSPHEGLLDEFCFGRDVKRNDMMLAGIGAYEGS